MAAEIIAIASDHAGFEYKDALKRQLAEWGYEALDLGTESTASVDYPDFGKRLAKAVAEGKVRRGVIICGTGIGISIAANREPKVRAALCHDVTSARLARRHNDANVLALGARVTGLEVARDTLRAFLDTEFEGGRHQGRVAKLGA
ncbi:MAG: ribose 5-phosphate isomerase B [Reyranellaceae bacterium]